MNKKTLKELKLKSNQIRIDILNMLYEAGTGHPGGALGLVEVFQVLYNLILKHDFKNPKLKVRDFFLLSNGHVNPVLYATLADQGYFPRKELKTLRKLGSRLQGHPHLGSVPGIENSSGPLGQGISQAVGLASSLKRDKKTNRVYSIVGDGELEEGQCWEAFIYAAKENLDNLCVIVDKNNIQIDGPTNNVLKLDLLHKKFSSFGFFVIEIDGNNLVQVEMALKEAKKVKGKPICIIAKNIPGKGVSYMENNYQWHGKVPNKDEFDLAIKELKKAREELEK